MSLVPVVRACQKMTGMSPVTATQSRIVLVRLLLCEIDRRVTETAHNRKNSFL